MLACTRIKFREAYRKNIINNVMLDIKRLASLQARGPVGREANPQKLFQFVNLCRVPIASIAIETNENYVYFKRNLERNLLDTPYT